MQTDLFALVAAHTAISLIAIAAGFMLVAQMIGSRPSPAITKAFLLATALTSLTGFVFHREQLLPSHIVGIVALVVLGVTLLARGTFALRGAWRAVYVVGIVVSLWLNVFVLVAQLFLKVPALHALAPNGSEPPFAAAQGVVFVLFVVLAVRAVQRYRPA